MKYSYITLLNDERYLLGTLCLNESLKNVKSKYPLVVAVTDNITKDIIKVLKNNDIDILEIKKVEIPQEIKEKNNKGIFSHWNNTFDKLRIFELTRFDKLVFLDSDMFIRNNIDCLFEKENFSAVIDRREPDVKKDWVKLTSGMMVIEPEDKILDKFKSVMENIGSKRESFGDQDILQEYNKKWEYNTNLHLDVKYNAFFMYLDYYTYYKQYKLEDIDVVHFILKVKPWNIENTEDYMKYIDDRLRYNYCNTNNIVYKKCLDIGSNSRMNVLMEYMDLLKTVRKKNNM